MLDLANLLRDANDTLREYYEVIIRAFMRISAQPQSNLVGCEESL